MRYWISWLVIVEVVSVMIVVNVEAVKLAVGQVHVEEVFSFE